MALVRKLQNVIIKCVNEKKVILLRKMLSTCMLYSTLQMTLKSFVREESVTQADGDYIQRNVGRWRSVGTPTHTAECFQSMC